MWAVELNDPHPQWGGKTVKAPFAFKAHADLWAREEVSAAKELGMGNVTYRIYRLAPTRE